MKPLSPKTLEKKYTALGLSHEKIKLLHDYFLCFSNLYGVLSVGEGWEIFRHYEGIRLLHKKDFIAFSGIVQREAGHPYSVLELREVYTGETTQDPAQRLIVNKRLIMDTYRKYVLLYHTVESQINKPYYLPAKKASFLDNTEDRFFLSKEGKQMICFLGKLKTSGLYRGLYGESGGMMLDLDGNPVADKRLRDFVFYTQDELFEIDYARSDAKKEKLRQTYQTTALDKILDAIFMVTQTGGYLPHGSLTNTLQFLTDFLIQHLGVDLTKAQMEEFFRLYTELNNRSHLWLNGGWRPDELLRRQPSGLPASLSIGPGLKKLLDQGVIDRAEFERQLTELGIQLSGD